MWWRFTSAFQLLAHLKILALPLLALAQLLQGHRSGIEGFEPPFVLNITAATLWKCSRAGESLSQDLYAAGHELQLEVLSAREEHIEIIAYSNSSGALESLGLGDCTLSANMTELILSELLENWDTLRHHASPETVSSITGSTPGLLASMSSSSPRVTVLKRSTCKEQPCEGKDQSSSEGDEWFTRYHNISQIYHWFRNLSENHPSVVTMNHSIGKTYYERGIFAVHFTDKSTGGSKPKIYLQCLLHAREWISGSVCMYIARYLANPDQSNIMLKNLLKLAEFIMVPVANPDGYFLSWLQYPKYRLWRKNVSPLNGTECAGVDLNRNFDTHWSEVGSSTEPCDELYHGVSAASELEVQAITSYLQSHGPLYGAIDFHSYHQEILYPPAWTLEDAEIVATLDYIAQWVASAASQVGVQYTSRKMNSIYLASGTFPDWLLEHSHRLSSGPGSTDHLQSHCVIPLTVELRPKPHPEASFAAVGFLLPTSEILPTCQEMVPAVVKFAQLALEKAPKCSSL